MKGKKFLTVRPHPQVSAFARCLRAMSSAEDNAETEDQCEKTQK